MFEQQLWPWGEKDSLVYQQKLTHLTVDKADYSPHSTLPFYLTTDFHFE